MIGSCFVFRRCALWLLPLLLLVCAPAYSDPSLSDSEFARLCALTTEHVTEITRARDIAEKAGYRLATYGGTSREIALFVRKKIAEVGGAAEFEKWIRGTDRLHLLDWHHIQSDLDLLLIPVKGGKASETELAAVAKQIEQSLPGNIFFKETDVRVASTFFREHPPDSEHFEPISNVAFGRTGIEQVDQLTVDVNGKQRSLSEWGLSQLNRGQLDFEVNLAHQKSEDAYGAMRQFLRWMRYVSELSDFELTPDSRKQLKAYFEWLKKQHGESIRHLLQQGDRGFVNKDKPDLIGEKLIEALEKLQLYTPDPYRTNQLMDEVGLSAFLKQAGVAHRRQLKPLQRLGVPPTPKGAAPAKPKLLRHRTSLAAAQNISLGAMWASDNETIIRGKHTAAALGTGLYAAEGFQSVGYGDMYVELELHPHARRGIDYTESGGYYTIINRDAIVAVKPLTLESLRRNFEDQLSNPEISRGDKASILRGLASLYYPESHPEEWADFEKTLKIAEDLKLQSTFISAYLNRPGSVEYLTALPIESTIRRSLNNYLNQNPALVVSLGAAIPASEKATWDRIQVLLQDPTKSIDGLTGILVAMSARSESLRRQNEVPDRAGHSYSFWDDRTDDYDELRRERAKEQQGVSDHFWQEYLVALKNRAKSEQYLSLLLIMPQRAWEPHVLPLLDQPNSLEVWRAISQIPGVKFNENIWEKLRNSWKTANPELRAFLSELIGQRTDWDDKMGKWSEQVVRQLPPGKSFPALAVAAARHLKSRVYLTAADIAEAKALLDMAGDQAPEVAKVLADRTHRPDKWMLERAFANNNNGIALEGNRELLTRDWTSETKQTALEWLRSEDVALQSLGLSVLLNRAHLSSEEWQAVCRIADLVPMNAEDTWRDPRPGLLSYVNTIFSPDPKEWTPEIWRAQSRFVHQGNGFLQRVQELRPVWQDSSWAAILENLERNPDISSWKLELAWRLATARDQGPPAELWKMIVERKYWGIVAKEEKWPREAWIAALEELSQETENSDSLRRRKQFFSGEELRQLLEILLNRPDAPQELREFLKHPFIRSSFLKGSFGTALYGDISPQLKASYEAALARSDQQSLEQLHRLESYWHASPSKPVVMEQKLFLPKHTISYRCRNAYISLGNRLKVLFSKRR